MKNRPNNFLPLKLRHRRDVELSDDRRDDVNALMSLIARAIRRGRGDIAGKLAEQAALHVEVAR